MFQEMTMDKQQIGNILRDIRNSFGFTQVEVAQKTDLSQSYINKLEKGLVNYDRVSRGVTTAISDMYNLRPEAWDIILQGNLTYEQIPQFLKTYSKDAQPEPQRTPEPPVKSVTGTWENVLGLAAAGEAFYSDSNVLYKIFIPTDYKRPKMGVVCISGDSMLPTMKQGDHVLFDRTEMDLVDGKIYVIHIQGEGHVVKRAKRKDNDWWLTSDNPEYFPFQAARAGIRGRVYGVLPALIRV